MKQCNFCNRKLEPDECELGIEYCRKDESTFWLCEDCYRQLIYGDIEWKEASKR